MKNCNVNISGDGDTVVERLAFSPSEAAALIGVGKTTLYALIASGELPSCRIAGRRLIRRIDLVGMLESARCRAANDVPDRIPALPVPDRELGQ